MRPLGSGLHGVAYGFDSVDQDSVLVSHNSARGQLEVWRAGRDEIVLLSLQGAESDTFVDVLSLAFHSETGAYFVVTGMYESGRVSIEATSDLGRTWENHGSMDRGPHNTGMYQLHFLAGSPDLFMRTFVDWLRLPLEPPPSTGLQPEGSLSVQWGRLKRQ